LNQKIWHQKKDVGDVVFHTASGSFGFRFGQFSELEKYVNYWLYQVESSKKKWM
jgi:putative membrane protein